MLFFFNLETIVIKNLSQNKIHALQFLLLYNFISDIFKTLLRCFTIFIRGDN